MKIIRKKFSKIGIGIVALLVFISLIIASKWTDKDKVSNNFAKQLLDYPLPPQTEVIEKEQVNGKSLVSGNGGYWGVIASIRLSTKQSKEEILLYYQKAGLFNYPKSDKRGVEPEIYFEDNLQKVERSEGYFFRSEDGSRLPLRTYFEESGEMVVTKNNIEETDKELEYVVQITSDFDYFLNIN